MPNTDLLQGLNVFDKSSAPEDGGSADILSQLINPSSSATPQRVSSKLVMVGAGLPALPKKLVDQVQAGQYIDFSELPPAKGRTRPLPNQGEG